MEIKFSEIEISTIKNRVNRKIDKLRLAYKCYSKDGERYKTKPITNEQREQHKVTEYSLASYSIIYEKFLLRQPYTKEEKVLIREVIEENNFNIKEILNDFSIDGEEYRGSKSSPQKYKEW